MCIYQLFQIKNKVVYLIQKWGLRYEKQQEIVPLFNKVYKALLANGVKFPDIPNKDVKAGSSGGTDTKPDTRKEEPGKVPTKY